MAQGDDVKERRKAVEWILESLISSPDKKELWDDLHLLSKDNDGYVLLCITECLSSAFSHCPMKDLLWIDLFRIAQHRSKFVQRCAEEQLLQFFLTSQILIRHGLTFLNTLKTRI